MKQLLFITCTLLASVNSFAQWKEDKGISDNTILIPAFGIHDTLLFASLFEPGVYATVVSRGPHSNWIPAGNGINFTDRRVTNFSSVGRFIFAGETYNPLGSSLAVFRSSDNGASWTKSGYAPGWSSGSYLFGINSSTLNRSRDTGAIWEDIPCPPAIGFYAVSPSIIVVGAGGSIERSTDSGTTWSKIAYPLPPPQSFVVLGSKMFAGAPTGANGIGVSTDSGTSWHVLDFPHQIGAFATDSTNLFVGTLDSGVFVSLDTGRTWKTINDGLGSCLKINSMIVFDTLLYVSADRTTSDHYYFNAYRPLFEVVPPKSAVQPPYAEHDTIAIYPNPTTSSIRIDLGSAAVHRVELLNLLGESKQVIQPREQQFVSLDLSPLPSGTYFLRIETAKGSEIRKIVRE